MNIQKHISTFLILVMVLSANLNAQSVVPSQASASKKLTQAQQQQMVTFYQAQEEKLFFPATLPTTSMYEASVETIYGPHGLNLPALLVTQIKQFYCFLEFITKTELATTQANYEQYKTTFAPFLEPQKTVVYPTQELVNSQAWKNIKISAQQLVASTAWQNILRSCIADSFVQDAITLEIIHQVESKVFSYLPSIEVNYYNYDFVRLKNLNEITRVKAILQHNVRTRNLEECSLLAQQAVTKVINASAEFKTTQFYINTHNLSYWTNPQDTKTTPVLASPLKEQVWLYFMMQYLQTKLYATMHAQSLLATLALAGSAKIVPNFFRYTVDDYCYLNDYLSLKERFAQDHSAQVGTTTQHAAKELYKPEELVNVAHVHQEHLDAKTAAATSVKNQQFATNKQQTSPTKGSSDVRVQSFWGDISNFASSVAHSITSTAPKIWNDLKDAGSAIEEAAHGAVEGTIGIGADMLGTLTGNPALEQYGDAKLHQAAHEISQATTNLEHDMTQIGSDLKNGFKAPMHELDSDFNSLLTTLKNSAQTAWQGLEAAGEWMEKEGEQIGLDALEDGAKLGDFVVNSVMTFYVNSGMQSVFKTIIHDTLWVLAKAWFYIKYGVGKALTWVMKALATVTNAVTSAIIWTTKSIVYLGAQDAAALGFNVNPQEAEDKVDMYLEAHRSSINVGVGIVLAIAVDVAVTALTAGAGAAFASAGVAAESTATVVDVAAGAADVAGGVADATEGVASLAADAGDIAADAGETAAQTSEDAATSTAEEGGETAAKEATEDATKEGAQDSAKESAEETTKETGEDAAKDSAKEEPSENNEENAKEDNKPESEKDAESNAKKRFNKFKDLFKDAMKKNLFNKMKLLMTFVNVGFNSFGFISSIGQNAQGIAQQNATFDMVRNLWASTETSQLSSYYNQKDYLDEISLKLQAQLGNNTLGLLYTKNYINGSTNMNTQQMQTVLSSVYTNLLTPQSIDNSNPQDTIIPAALGNMWGLDCPFISLYPSQGFLTCTKGRADFPYAQEIACAPLSATLSSDATTAQNNKDAQFWFNQRAITVLDTPQKNAPTTIEMSMQLLYTLTTPFHAGLYVGGTYYNYTSPKYLAQIAANGADIDAAHGALMFVFNKPKANAPVHIGLYQHEGEGWIVNEPVPASLLNHAYTYHFKIEINGTQITATLFAQENPAMNWTHTATVQNIDTRTLGVIYSGAALQWNFITPQLTPITDHTSLRPPFAGLVKEQEREQKAQAAWSLVAQPPFGSFHLEICDKIALLNGQYVYTTQDTNLKTETNQPITDYVVFAQQVHGLQNIGMQPLPTSVNNGIEQVIISLVTGNVYDQTGKVIDHQDNTYASYQTKTGPLAVSISNGVAQTNALFAQAFVHITTGPFDLTAISMPALCGGYRIYSCAQTITTTYESKPITDYLLFVTQNNGAIKTSNCQYGSDVNGLYSLVTQNVYALTSLTPLVQGDALNAFASGLQTFDKEYKNFAPSYPQEHAALQTATTQYIAAITPATPTQPVEKKSATTTIHFSGLPTSTFAPYQTPQTQGLRIGNALQAPAVALPTQLNLLNQQKSAAHGFEIATGGLNAQGGGLHFGAPVVEGGHGGFEIPTTFVFKPNIQAK